MKLCLLVLFLSTISLASAQENIIADDTDFDTGNGFLTTVLAGQQFTEITVSDTLEFFINGIPEQFAANNNIALSNIVYSNDILNFTASASSGTLTISAQMHNSNTIYFLYVDGTNSESTTSNSTGWVTFMYSGWSQHDFSIKADTIAPTLTSESVSPSSTEQGNSVTISAHFTDNIAVASAIVNVESPDGLSLNWSMVCTQGASVTCIKQYNEPIIDIKNE